MPRNLFHTVPNQVSVRTVLGAGQHARTVCVVSRDRQALAYYLPEWTANRVPSLTEVQRDARWQIAPTARAAAQDIAATAREQATDAIYAAQNAGRAFSYLDTARHPCAHPEAIRAFRTI